MTPRVVFACSGAADNLAAIPQLAAEFNAEIVALTLDLGQAGELEAIRQAALTAGAVRAHVLDARDEFARCCIAASLGDAPAAYRAGHTVACVLIARKLVEIARIEAADLVAHGGGEEDHAEIETAARALHPSIRVVRTGTARAQPPHAVHGTLWERPPEDPSTSMPKPEPDAPARLEIAFEAGLPVSINGIPMTLPELIESVSTIAGTHGVGRVLDTSGAAVHAPAAVVLQAAHNALGAAAARASGATVCVELFRGQHRILSAHHS
jgi:argininosuccinate synthase